jgi:hypothetical protein
MYTKPMRGGLREKTPEEVTMPLGKKRRSKTEGRDTSRRKKVMEGTSRDCPGNTGRDHGLTGCTNP